MLLSLNAVLNQSLILAGNHRCATSMHTLKVISGTNIFKQLTGGAFFLVFCLAAALSREDPIKMARRLSEKIAFFKKWQDRPSIHLLLDTQFGSSLFRFRVSFLSAAAAS